MKSGRWQRRFLLTVGSVFITGHWLTPATCAQSPSAPNTPHPVAVVAGKAITEDELNSRIAPQLRQLQNQEYELKSQALENLIDQKLLESEAERRGITVADLLKQEVDSKTPQPTDAEVEAVYQGQKDRINQPLEQVKDQLRQLLLQNRAQQVRQGFLRGLRDQASVSVYLVAPRIQVDPDPHRMRGDPDAPITIVEFSDFQCPFCQKAYPVIQGVLSKYAKQVKFSYRDFPLRGLHPQAQMAAEASRCAGEQGKFWEYHDSLFETPNQLSKEELTLHAATIGLDTAGFQTCLASGRFDTSIEKDLQDGTQAGVSGTPAFFINGILVSGAQPASVFERTINSELAAHKQAGVPAR